MKYACHMHKLDWVSSEAKRDWVKTGSWGSADGLDQACAVLVDDLDVVGGRCNDQAALDLGNALLHHVQCFCLCEVRMPELVKQRQHKHGACRQGQQSA